MKKKTPLVTRSYRKEKLIPFLKKMKREVIGKNKNKVANLE